MYNKYCLIAYILWFDGEWQCVYVGNNFDDGNAAIRKHGPADGHAITWCDNADRLPVFRMEMNLTRIPNHG